jgi:hypothetical protein
MSATHPEDLAERLHARPRLCDYGDTDLAETEAHWVVWKGRRREPLPRDFLVHHAPWGAYEFEAEIERGHRP